MSKEDLDLAFSLKTNPPRRKKSSRIVGKAFSHMNDDGTKAYAPIIRSHDLQKRIDRHIAWCKLNPDSVTARRIKNG